MTAAAPHALKVHKDGWRSVEPTPTPGELKAFYSGAYFQESHGTYAQAYSEVELKHRALLAELMLHALGEARAGAAGGKLLEIGCGEGWFLKAALAAGYEARGLEFSDFGLKRFNPALAGRVEFGDAFEALDRLIAAREQVEVCVMEHVLEHVADPQALLARLPAHPDAPGAASWRAPCPTTSAPCSFGPRRLATSAGISGSPRHSTSITSTPTACRACWNG